MSESLEQGFDSPADRPSRDERPLLGLLVAVALLHGLLWAILMPPWQIPDEPYYFASAQQAAISAGWVPATASIAAAPRQPVPLFAWSAAPVVAAFKDSPNAAMYVLRLIAVLFSVAVVLLGFWAAKEVFADDPRIAWGTALSLSLLPMLGQYFSEGAPDVLANLGGALLFWGAARTISLGYAPGATIAAVLGAALGATSKNNGLFLVGMLALIPLFALARPRTGGRTRGTRTETIAVLALSGAAVLAAVAGAWLLNAKGFGSGQILWALGPSGWIATLFDLGKGEPLQLFESFWGKWGWSAGPGLTREWMPALKLLCLASMAGLALLFARLWHARADGRRRARLAALAFMLIGGWAAVLQAVAYGRTLGYSGSKWLYPAIVPIVMLFVAGLAEWVSPERRAQALAGYAGALAVFDAIGAWLYVRPHYYEAFPATLRVTAQNIWEGSVSPALVDGLVFGWRPAPLRWTLTYLGVQLLLWLALASLVRRVLARGRGTGRPDGLREGAP